MSETEDPIVVVAYDPRWPQQFREIATELRQCLGAEARRIDHVGSTAVPGLSAKDVIDIQISVADLSGLDRARPRLQAIEYVFQANNPDRSKRMFREPGGRRRTHVHVRPQGSFDEQLNLLFRDFLRGHPDAAAAYAAEKRSFAERFRNDRQRYVAAKEPTLWRLLMEAHDWAQSAGWSAPPTDA